jgi:hypothetical protein
MRIRRTLRRRGRDSGSDSSIFSNTAGESCRTTGSVSPRMNPKTSRRASLATIYSGSPNIMRISCPVACVDSACREAKDLRYEATQATIGRLEVNPDRLTNDEQTLIHD